MNKAQIKEMRDLLLQKRKALLGDLAGIRDQAIGKNRREGSGDLSNMPTHQADIGSDNYEQEFTLGLLESERALLQEIDEALERVRSNTYGLCVATGKPIGLARLRARPWAKYCIEYAKMLEKGLVRIGEGEESEEQEAEGEEEREDQEKEPERNLEEVAEEEPEIIEEEPEE
ncbi:MAG TPA: TraR/DksA family transcriptional regulator [Phycisphaerae bacterium]|nr:TraR/DksA family transcriptional regulator [Phycisphaerae bacterium]